MENEKRPIDANALKEQIAKEIHTYWTNGTGGYYLAEDVIPDIDNAPTVDAVEVVHGSWIHASNKPGVWIGMKCSLCGARIRYTEFTNGNHNYCHKCGAKMDGGDEDG